MTQKIWEILQLSIKKQAVEVYSFSSTVIKDSSLLRCDTALLAEWVPHSFQKTRNHSVNNATLRSKELESPSKITSEADKSVSLETVAVNILSNWTTSEL